VALDSGGLAVLLFLGFAVAALVACCLSFYSVVASEFMIYGVCIVAVVGLIVLGIVALSVKDRV